MNRYVLVLLSLGAIQAYGQQDSSAPPKYGWAHSVVAGLTATQVSFNNWTQGGENALAYTVSLEGKSTDDLAEINWANDYKFAYGQTRLGDQGVRKTDDKIDLASVLSYKLGGVLNPYVAATFKTQFTRGYKYDGGGTATGVSDFFDPGYLTQSAGAVYQPIPEAKTRFGFALREIVTSRFAPLYTDDPSTAGVEKTRVNGGLESVTEVNWKLADNILLTSKLELFDAFNAMDVIIVRSDNTLAMKVNKYIVVNVNVQLINERPVSPRMQVKQTLALGLTYSLI